ncbi:DUF2271 domain-containing protein [Saccharicrinis sp. FJH2]|uniref:DUF2271 domain-containing protein n=1 Tax=Saccharicrinis sp. FJH65 TaxID=3344659 RepID=UPI0035F27999
MNRRNILWGVFILLFVVLGFTACQKSTSNPSGSTNVTISGDHLNFTFSTANLSGRYAPRYVMAVWVEDSSGEFVTSLAVYAQARKQYLVKWYGSSKGITTDAVTGATILGTQTFDVAWNLKDYMGNRVPEGTYKIYLEETSNDAPGPGTSVSVNVGKSSYSENPAGSTHFKNLSVDFVVADTAGISSSAYDLKQTIY